MSDRYAGKIREMRMYDITSDREIFRYDILARNALSAGTQLHMDCAPFDRSPTVEEREEVVANLIGEVEYLDLEPIGGLRDYYPRARFI